MTQSLESEEDRPWRWRNTRNVTVQFGLLLMPWQWAWHLYLDGGYDAYTLTAVAGPFVIDFRADIGNISTGDWRARFGLSAMEAWDRCAPKREGSARE